MKAAILLSTPLLAEFSGRIRLFENHVEHRIMRLAREPL
jgi:hypothetical protein